MYTVPGRETSKVLRLHVHGGVRALVPMLSADIARDRPRARACGATILSLRNRAFFLHGPRALGTWVYGKWVPGRKDPDPRGVGDIRLISAREEVPAAIVINYSN